MCFLLPLLGMAAKTIITAKVAQAVAPQPVVTQMPVASPIAPQRFSSFGTATGGTPQVLQQGIQTASLGGIAGRAIAGGAAMARGAVGIIRSSTGKISGIRLGSGAFVSRKKAVALAKKVGIEAAALALGLTAMQMAEMVVTAPTRRRRGISATDIKRTKSTLRKVCNLSKEFSNVKKARKSCR